MHSVEPVPEWYTGVNIFNSPNSQRRIKSIFRHNTDIAELFYETIIFCRSEQYVSVFSIDEITVRCPFKETAQCGG